MTKPSFHGPTASRARALSRKKRRPKFALGEVVLAPHGDVGAIGAIYANLAAAHATGILGGTVRSWLAMQRRRPKTRATGIWYSLVYGRGTGLAGELDLRRAPPGSKPLKR